MTPQDGARWPVARVPTQLPAVRFSQDENPECLLQAAGRRGLGSSGGELAVTCPPDSSVGSFQPWGPCGIPETLAAMPLDSGFALRPRRPLLPPQLLVSTETPTHTP